MSMFLYNNADDTFKPLYRTAYESLDEYISPQTADTTVYDLVFFASITDVFNIAKRRSAIRSRFAKDAEGKSLIDKIAMTDDERDFFDDIFPSGAAEVFKKLSAYAKNVTNAFKYGVTLGPKTATGTVDSVNGAIITDNSLTLTPGALKGHKFVITSGELIDQEKTIVDNTATTIVLEEAWEQDITGEDFNVYNPAADYVIYTVSLDNNWDVNMLQNCDNAILEALVAYTLKEWYLINRYGDDYGIEEAKYQNELANIRSSLSYGKKAYRRPADFFSG